MIESGTKQEVIAIEKIESREKNEFESFYQILKHRASEEYRRNCVQCPET